MVEHVESAHRIVELLSADRQGNEPTQLRFENEKRKLGPERQGSHRCADASSKADICQDGMIGIPYASDRTRFRHKQRLRPSVHTPLKRRASLSTREGATMKTSEEKRWELVQQQLLAESRGDAPTPVVSQRTLFGIKSHVEEVIDRTAAEDSARCKQQARRG